MTEERTQFDYLLNSFEHASQSDKPAENGYAQKRRALFAYVRELEARPTAEQVRELVMQERERAEQDAKRYRWLRGRDSRLLATIAWGASPVACGYAADDVDAAIDAAIRS